MVRSLKVGYCTIFIYKERGNLYVKDGFGESKPLLFAAYGSDSELICLRDYMNIKNLTLKEAVEVLNDCGAVLVGHTFNIYFYDEEAVEKFIKLTE